MSAQLTVHKYSHYFKVTRVTPRSRSVVTKFIMQFLEYGYRPVRGHYNRTILKVYAASTEDRSEFRFHINTWKDFQDALKRDFLTDDLVEIIEYAIPEPLPLGMKVKAIWQPKDNQVGAIDYLVKEGGSRIRFLESPTGTGKSYMTMQAIADIGELPIYCIRPTFIEKAIEDIYKTYEGVTVEDIIVVRGANQLMSLLMMASTEGISWKFVIVSNKTIQTWIKLYERHKEETLEMGYACLPDQLHQVLRTGLLINDEVHLDFHMNFKASLYTHVKKSIGLSATLIPDNPFRGKMAEVMFPKEQRYINGVPKKYIDAICMTYRFTNPDKIRSVNHMTGMYSHNLLEQSVMKNKVTTENYFRLIDLAFKEYFLKTYKAGETCLIYAGMTDFCTILTEYMKLHYPQFNVRRYASTLGDSYDEDLMGGEVVVTTLGSAGTGVDKPGLKTVILSLAISSSQSNVQGFGRLRELKDGTVPQFVFFCCNDIAKHIEYADKKKEILRTRAARVLIHNVGESL